MHHGLKGKKTHASKQVDEGEGYSVDVADEAAFKHYVFVNADEYGLFDHPQRRFLKTVVCYQVLSTAWNSSTKHDPSSLKPRFLFLFSDALFVMKMHDVTDTNTRRYRILGRINLLDLTVEEVGDDMFDLLARGMGAMRFSVGSSITKTQTVTAFRKAIRHRQGRAGGRHARVIPPTGAPSNPDDVYATMNFALSVLEKKMRGTATEEEQWQVDTLLAHALEMQERLHGPQEPSSMPGMALPAVSGGALSGPTTSRGASGSAALQAQLQAKEAQLRAMEERAAAAEAAVSRLRGSTAAVDASNTENRNLTLENRTLRLDADRLRAQLEERDKQLAGLREEAAALRKAARVGAATDLAYHEGSVDEVLSRIQRGPPAGAGVAVAAPAPARDAERDREEADRSTRERLQAEQEERKREEDRRRREAELVEEERKREADSKRKQEQERRAREEEEADRKFRQLQEAKSKVDQQKSANIDASLDQFLGAAPITKKAATKPSTEEESSSSVAAPSQPAAAVARPKASVVAAAAKAAARGGSDDSSEALSTDGEDGSFSTSASESEGAAGDDLRTFLSQHELGHVRKQLEDRVSLQLLRAMDLAGVRGLGLSYADSSNLATALGIKVVH